MHKLLLITIKKFFNDYPREQIFVIFRHFPPERTLFLMLRLQLFDFYSGKLVIDSFWIVKLVQICYELVIQLVLDLL